MRTGDAEGGPAAATSWGNGSSSSAAAHVPRIFHHLLHLLCTGDIGKAGKKKTGHIYVPKNKLFYKLVYFFILESRLSTIHS